MIYLFSVAITGQMGSVGVFQKTIYTRFKELLTGIASLALYVQYEQTKLDFYGQDEKTEQNTEYLGDRNQSNVKYVYIFCTKV